jgi:hypothetical protein
MECTLNTSVLAAQAPLVPIEKSPHVPIHDLIWAVDFEAEFLTDFGNERGVTHRVHLFFKEQHQIRATD